MRKIMVAVHTYYPQKNGVQTVTEYIAEGLQKKGNDVLVVTRLIEGTIRSEEYNGVKIERIHVNDPYYRIFTGDIKKYHDIIKDFCPDVMIIVCVETWTFDWILPILKKTSIKKILYTHGYPAYESDYHILDMVRKGKIKKSFYKLECKLYYWIVKRASRKFDIITYLSKYDKAYLFAREHGLKNSIILGNAVDNKFWEYNYCKNEKNFYNNKEIIFLCVSNYIESKNQEMLLKAFYRLDSNNIKLILVGERKSEYYYKLINNKKELEKKYGNKNVNILYGLSREKVIELYRHVDVFIMPSKLEAYPVVICEAAASGIAVITTDVGNVREFPGIIIVQNEEEMRNQMEMLIKKPEIRNKKGILLRQYAEEECKIENKIEKLQNEIDKLFK